MISFSSLANDVADAVIGEEAAHYREQGAHVEWKVYRHDSPPDLLERVERHGFTPGPPETVLVLDLQNHPGWIDATPTHSVMRIENSEHVNVYRRSAEAIFGKDHGSTAGELLSAITKGSMRHRGYLVMEGKTAVSLGRLSIDVGSVFAGLYGGGTLEHYRHRGFYRATVAARARDAVSAGARYLIVDALPTSRPILEDLGFVRLTETWPCTLAM